MDLLCAVQQTANQVAKEAGMSSDEEEADESEVRKVMPGEAAAAALAAANATANALNTAVRIVPARCAPWSPGPLGHLLADNILYYRPFSCNIVGHGTFCIVCAQLSDSRLVQS